jgi:diguanylate cyclase (GGDEF)-like protein
MRRRVRWNTSWAPWGPLIHIAKLIRAQIRHGDDAARWGGDEFLILLHDCDLSRLKALSRRLCDNVAQNPLQTDTEAISLSISAGTCLCQPDDSLESLLRRADLALYDAKKAGRNRVHTHHRAPAVSNEYAAEQAESALARPQAGTGK